MKRFKEILLSFLASFIVAAVAAMPAYAASGNLSIPVSTVIRGDEGSSHVLAEKEVAEGLVGMVCAVMATGENQSSVHPGNNIVITSGSGQISLKDVERAANVTTHADGTLTLSDRLVATLTLGEDKVFSGGMSLEFDCEEPKQIQVCREGKMVTINEQERLEADTDAPCVLGEVDMPKTLPNTGIGGVLSGVFGAGAMGAGVKTWLDSRSMLKAGILRKEQ